MTINKTFKEILKECAIESAKIAGYVGLAAAVLIGADRACHEIGKHVHLPKVETAQLTDATFERQAKVTFQGPNYTVNKTIFVYDLDGKADESGQRTAEEAFECPYRYSAYESTYGILSLVSITEWKHYVAPGVNKPLVSNNITPMTAEQRELFSKVLNLYQEPVKQK